MSIKIERWEVGTFHKPVLDPEGEWVKYGTALQLQDENEQLKKERDDLEAEIERLKNVCTKHFKKESKYTRV